MAGVLHVLDQQRLFDSDGLSDGGTITFYLTETSTKTTIYSDVGLTTPIANPVIVNAGAAVPSIYLDDTKTYRRVITYSDGSTDEDDPYTLPAYLLEAAGYAAQTAADVVTTNTNATNAATSETAAETALSTIISALAVDGNYYTDTTIAAAISTAEGALTNGDEFVAGGDDVDYVGFYTISGGSAVEIIRVLSTAGVEAALNVAAASNWTTALYNGQAFTLSNLDQGRWSTTGNVLYRADGLPLPAVWDDFVGTASDELRDRPLPHSRLRKYQDEGGYTWRKHAGTFEIDSGGTGVIATGSVPSAATTYLRTCHLTDAGLAGDRIIRVEQARGSGQSQTIIGMNGRYAVVFAIIGSDMIIREFDFHNGADTYGSDNSGATFSDLDTDTYSPGTGFNDTEEFIISVVGQNITVTQIATGTQLTGTASQPLGPEVGISTTSTNVKTFNHFSAYDLEEVPEVALSSTVTKLGYQKRLRVYDCDSLSEGVDMSGNGLPDFVTTHSSGGNGNIAKIVWLEQYKRGLYREHVIDTNASPTGTYPTDRFTKVQAVWPFQVNGNWYVFASGQNEYRQWIYYPDDPKNLRGTWSRTELTGNFRRVRGIRKMDILGTDCIVLCAEGTDNSTGFVIAYPIPTSDVRNAASWVPFTIKTVAGAWGLPQDDTTMVDLDQDGIAESLVVSCRHGPSNTSAVGLIIALEPTDTDAPFDNGEWTQTILYDAINDDGDDLDLVQFSIGDWSGDGNGLDILVNPFREWVAAVHTDIAAAAFYLKFSDSWSKQATTTLGLGTNKGNALFRFPRASNKPQDERDSFGFWVEFQGLYQVYWNGSAWASNLIVGTRFSHQVIAPFTPRWAYPDGTVGIYFPVTPEDGGDEHGFFEMTVKA